MGNEVARAKQKAFLGESKIDVYDHNGDKIGEVNEKSCVLD